MNDSNSAAVKPENRRRSSLRVPGLLRNAALWLTCLWAFATAVGLSGMDLALRRVRQQATNRTMLLLPQDEPDEIQRGDLKREMEKRETVARAHWISPSDLAQRTSAVIQRDLWPELFSEDQAWLPWLMEVRFHQPLGDAPAIFRLVEELRGSDLWQLALWDQAALNADRRLRRRILLGGTAGVLMAFLLGGAGLILSASSRNVAVSDALAGVALVSLPILFLGVSVELAGIALDRRAWLLALGVGFILAALPTAVLKWRRFTTRRNSASESES